MIHQIIKFFLLAVLILFSWTAHGQVGVDDIVSKACHSGEKSGSVRCLRACNKAQSDMDLSDLSHAMRSACTWALTVSEAKRLNKSRCDRLACVYKLRAIGNEKRFVGAGFTLSVEKGIFDYYDMKIHDPRGRVTTFGLCGNCGVHEAAYIKGPLKSVKVSTAGNLIILKVPR